MHQDIKKALDKGKTKKLGFCERIGLRAKGRRDGRNSLPSPDSENHWTSSFLDREEKSFDELACRYYGALQIDLEDSYRELRMLVTGRSAVQKRLAGAREALRKVEEEPAFMGRKEGDEHLTDDQVAKRRSREHARWVEGFRREVRTLEAELQNAEDRCLELYHSAQEKADSTEAALDRVRMHQRQRADAYWDAARAEHISQRAMPLVPQHKAHVTDAQRRLSEKHKSILTAMQESLQKEE